MAYIITLSIVIDAITWYYHRRYIRELNHTINVLTDAMRQQCEINRQFHVELQQLKRDYQVILN